MESFEAARESIDSVIDIIHKENRTGNLLIVLQQYDYLLAMGDVQRIADFALDFRAQCQELEQQELAVNVLDPEYLASRLRGEAEVSQSSELTEEDTLARAVYATERRVETAWGVCLLAAVARSPDEEEYHREIVEEFEHTFDRPSELLRAFICNSTSAMDLLRKYEISEGNVVPDALVAVLTKHSPNSTQELNEVVEYAKEHGVPVTMAVAEMLEKSYVRCMKAEGAEAVFEQMLSVGLVPLSTRPFAMIFNSKSLKKGKSLLDYYELMLDYGITPEPSILRILCKQCTNVPGMEYAPLHFTLKVKSQTAAEEAAVNANPQTAVSGGGQSPPPPAPPDSRRKNERLYFEKRLNDLSEAHGDAVPLMEALKVVHRAEVEGTSLAGDTLILNCLLRSFCNGTTPLADLVFPFSNSKAYGPALVVLPPVVSGGADDAANKGSRRFPAFQETNAFDFGLGNTAINELLEDEGSAGPTLEDEMQPLEDDISEVSSDDCNDGSGHMDGRNGHRAEYANARCSDIARPAQEAEYVLKVLAEYGSFPDADLHRNLSEMYETRRKWKKPWDIGIIQHVAQARFKNGHDRKGTVDPVRSGSCHCLVHYYVRHHKRSSLVELVRNFIVQYYEYHTIFYDNWRNHPNRSAHYRQDNLLTFLTAAMKVGPLDWALGLLALALTTSDSSINTNTQARLYQVRDAEIYRSPHSEVVTIMRSCDWERSKVLCCDALMVDSHEQQLQREGAADNVGSIYTVPSQEPSSYTNQRGTDQHLTLINYMHIALREMNVGKEIMDYYKQRLRDASQRARAEAEQQEAAEESIE